MIHLICPTYGRPDKAAKMWASALRTAANKDNIRLSIGVNEEQVYMYRPALPEDVVIYTGMDWTTVFTLNNMAGEIITRTDDQLFFIVGDDTIFSTPNWDEALITAYNALENKLHVFSLLDSRSANGTPHPVITRAFVQAMGWLAPPIFMHWYVDTWLVDIAKANNCFTHLKDYLLIHDKPSDQGVFDETHLRIRDRGWNHRDNYVNEVCQDYLYDLKEKISKTLQQNAGTREHMD